MNKAYTISQRGAVGLDGKMIDAPMVKQVSHCAYWVFYTEKIVLQARKVIAMADAGKLNYEY